jgi:hypothetical protein
VDIASFQEDRKLLVRTRELRPEEEEGIASRCWPEVTWELRVEYEEDDIKARIRLEVPVSFCNPAFKSISPSMCSTLFSRTAPSATRGRTFLAFVVGGVGTSESLSSRFFEDSLEEDDDEELLLLDEEEDGLLDEEFLDEHDDEEEGDLP